MALKQAHDQAKRQAGAAVRPGGGGVAANAAGAPVLDAQKFQMHLGDGAPDASSATAGSVGGFTDVTPAAVSFGPGASPHEVSRLVQREVDQRLHLHLHAHAQAHARATATHAAASAMANSLSMQRSELAEAAEAFAACGDISLIHPFLGQSESDDA